MSYILVKCIKVYINYVICNVLNLYDERTVYGNLTLYCNLSFVIWYIKFVVLKRCFIVTFYLSRHIIVLQIHLINPHRYNPELSTIVNI